MQKRTLLKDIASKLGVSTAVVSYVVNGKEKEKRVGKELAEKIRKTAREMNYVPNQIAQSLRKGSTKTIGVIVADIANPFFGNMSRVIENEANKAGYAVIFGSSDENSVKSALLIKTLINRQVDGFIIAPSDNSYEQILELHNRKIPLVLIDRFFQDIDTNYITLNCHAATFEATNYLIEKKFKKIGLIAYQTSMVHIKQRIRGYMDAMKNHGMEDDIRIEEVRHGFVRKDVEEAVVKLVTGDDPCDALLFVTNSLSIAGLYAIHKLGIKVPDQLGVLGFDWNEAFDFFYSPVTHIDQPISEIGKEAVRVLVEEINGSEKKVHMQLKHCFTIKDSCR
jgi:LacI family transcriptional regulator